MELLESKWEEPGVWGRIQHAGVCTDFEDQKHEAAAWKDPHSISKLPSFLSFLRQEHRTLCLPS